MYGVNLNVLAESCPTAKLPNTEDLGPNAKRELQMDLFLNFISTLVSKSDLSQQSPLELGFGASIGLHEAKHSDPDTSKVIPDNGFARN